MTTLPYVERHIHHCNVPRKISRQQAGTEAEHNRHNTN